MARWASPPKKTSWLLPFHRTSWKLHEFPSFWLGIQFWIRTPSRWSFYRKNLLFIDQNSTRNRNLECQPSEVCRTASEFVLLFGTLRTTTLKLVEDIQSNSPVLPANSCSHPLLKLQHCQVKKAELGKILRPYCPQSDDDVRKILRRF